MLLRLLKKMCWGRSSTYCTASYLVWELISYIDAERADYCFHFKSANMLMVNLNRFDTSEYFEFWASL